MAESKEVVRERVRKFRELKKKLGVTVTECNDVTILAPKEVAPIVTVSFCPCERMVDLQARVEDLLDRVIKLEYQLSPDEVSRKQALKPGGHPNELYGA